MKIGTKTLFTLIVIGAAMIRLIGLADFSPPLNRDEAGIGYNAYSLLKTGMDEHGVSWPLAFKSIGDYKMPGYIYLTMLPVALFGLTETAVRFWSALAGVLAVISLWFLAKEFSPILPRKDFKQWLPPLAAFLLAINPWHIHYSRIGFEANVNLTLFLGVLLFFLKGLKNQKWLIISALLTVAMQYMYSSTFIFLPLLGLVLISIFWKPLFTLMKTNFRLFAVAFVVLVLGSIIALGQVASVSEAKQSITVFSDPTNIDTFNHERGAWNEKNIVIAKLWFNQYFYFGRTVAVNYLQNFSPGFLFFNAIHHPWHSVPGQGFFYYIDALFFFVGIVWLLKLLVTEKTPNKRLLWLLIGWLLLSPAASAITVDAPHATRSFYLLPVFILITALGVLPLVERLSRRLFNLRLVALSFVTSIYLLFFTNFIYQYLAVYPTQYPLSLFPGIKLVAQYLNQQGYPGPIYVSNAAGSVYLYVSFYGSIDPHLVQSIAVWKQPDTVGLTNVEQLGNYFFVDDTTQKADGALWVIQAGQPEPDGFTLEKEFKNSYTQNVEWRVGRT